MDPNYKHKRECTLDGGANDGVCIIKSMRSRKDMELIEVPYSHFEVMCSDAVADIILKRYYSVLEVKNFNGGVVLDYK